jgi:hypothetical protein
LGQVLTVQGPPEGVRTDWLKPLCVLFFATPTAALAHDPSTIPTSVVAPRPLRTRSGLRRLRIALSRTRTYAHR